MFTRFLYRYLPALLILTTCSCSKWLEVQPEDKFTEEQIYTTPAGIAEVLNGLYLKAGTNELYGRNLTLDKLDLFAQRYYGSTAEFRYYQYVGLNYEDETVKASIQSVWNNMYQLIGNANLFLEQLEKHKSILTPAKELQYKGEAMAIRSLAYFDLLRMFGPVYNSNDSTANAIPYYTKLSEQVGAFLPANQVMSAVLADVATAETWLANDPIVTETGAVNNNRYRFNLYAVKALKARMLLWRGSVTDKALALQTAKEVIAQVDKFPWVSHSAVSGGDADRIFSTELLLATFNNNLYTVNDAIFSSSLTELNIISTGPKNFTATVFENNSSDYRFEFSWMNGNFLKYRDLATTTLPRRFTIPVIRISEMFYIAAETETDPAKALEYLNIVRRHRNIATDVTNASLLQQELTKEYLKEFYGEGQLLYYYKRKMLTTVSSPNTTTGTTTVDLAKYVLPIPDSELQTR